MFPSPGPRHSCTCWSSLQLHGSRMVTTGIYDKIFLAAGKPAKQMPTSVPSLSSCKLSQSIRFFIASHDSFHSWNCDWVPHLSFSETCWLVLSVTPAFWIHVLAFHPAHDECLLLFHNGTFSQCGCAPCLCTLGTVNEMQSLYFSSKYFSYLWFPGSAIYLYYLLSSPCDPLQSTDKNWFLFCE